VNTQYSEVHYISSEEIPYSEPVSQIHYKEYLLYKGFDCSYAKSYEKPLPLFEVKWVLSKGPWSYQTGIQHLI